MDSYRAGGKFNIKCFWGPTINAAKGIAEQVNGAVSRFVASFQTAVNPQLIKLYAQDSIGGMISLLYRSTSFFILPTICSFITVNY